MTSSEVPDSLKYRLNNFLAVITNDFIILSMLYLMPLAFVDAYGILYSIGALALLKLLYSDPVTTQDLQRAAWEKKVLWLLPGLALLYAWVLEPQGWSVLKIDSFFTLSIGGIGKQQLFPGFVHLIILYLIPLTVMFFLKQIRNSFTIDRRILLYTGLIILPVVIRDFFGIEKLSGDQSAAGSFLLLGLKAFYIPGLGEELIYRGAIFNLFKRHFKLGYAVVFSSFVFTIVHYNLMSLFWTQPESALHAGFNLLAIWVLGCCMALIYDRTQNLLPCIIFHGAINRGIRFILYALLLTIGIKM